MDALPARETAADVGAADRAAQAGADRDRQVPHQVGVVPAAAVAARAAIAEAQPPSSPASS